MTRLLQQPASDVVRERAELSRGTSNDAIVDAVVREIEAQHCERGRLLDVGCGRGDLLHTLAGRFEERIGVDVVEYDGFATGAWFAAADLDRDGVPLPDDYVDCTTCVETIEHLENPRALVRDLTRVTRPGGTVIVTTPNQLSLASRLSLLVRGRFQAFQDVHYPAHITALLECDLVRIAGECGLESIRIAYTGRGRIPGVPWHFPRFVSRTFGRACSDNVLLVARRPQDDGEGGTR